MYAEEEFSYVTTPAKKTASTGQETKTPVAAITPQKRRKAEDDVPPVTPRRLFFFADDEEPSFLGRVGKKW